MLFTVLVIIVVLALIGAFPAHQRYGYSGSGGLLFTVIIILIVLWALGFMR
jgi:hypothetical protein